jgi:hypothetical protein
MSAAPRRVSWPALLDAMEERTRRLAAVLESGEGDPVPDVVAVPDAPLPPEYVDRVRELLAETIRLERIAAARTAAAATALHYARV